MFTIDKSFKDGHGEAMFECPVCSGKSVEILGTNVKQQKWVKAIIPKEILWHEKVHKEPNGRERIERAERKDTNIIDYAIAHRICDCNPGDTK